MAAVDSAALVQENVVRDGRWLQVGPRAIDLNHIERILVVGGGKAGAGMAAGLEAALGEELLASQRVEGWLNVPADCLRPLRRIHLHAARPAGVNEPTEAGVVGAERILALMEQAGPRDLCLCLLSGGGSALLPAPPAEVSLTDKQRLTRHLSGAGANIAQLNGVRKQLSRIKGGGLARACRGAELITLIISDVLGDPLEIISSGPTVPDDASPAAALATLAQFGALEMAPSAAAYLRAKLSAPPPLKPTCSVTNLVIGNNAVAVDAAGIEAERRGYSHAMLSSTTLEGPAEAIGVDLARQAVQMRTQRGPDALITGGEPTVTLAPPEIRGRGGRNQQLVLAALAELLTRRPTAEGIALLSGGTDGEDGPTDAAGAWLDAETLARVRSLGLDPAEHLRRNDAYPFFARTGSLLLTGPTHTNVCDLRVVLVDRIEPQVR